jgi:hypothetical protein
MAIHSLQNERPISTAMLIGWGIGVIAHGIAVWIHAPRKRLLDQMVAREYARLVASKNFKQNTK